MLLSFPFNRHRIHRRFERYKEHTWDVAGTQAAVWTFGRTISVGSRLQDRSALTLVGDVEFTCHQHHTLGRRVPMQRQPRFRGHLEKDVGIRLARISVQHSYLAPLRQERRAGSPLKLGVVCGSGDSRLMLRRLCASRPGNKTGRDQRRGAEHHWSCAVHRMCCVHDDSFSCQCYGQRKCRPTSAASHSQVFLTQALRRPQAHSYGSLLRPGMSMTRP